MVAGLRQKFVGADRHRGRGHIRDIGRLRGSNRVPHVGFQKNESSVNAVPAGMPSATRRSELYAYSTGLGIWAVWNAAVFVYPIGPSTFSCRSVSSSFLPIMDRILPRIMKLVCA